MNIAALRNTILIVSGADALKASLLGSVKFNWISMTLSVSRVRLKPLMPISGLPGSKKSDSTDKAKISWISYYHSGVVF